MRIVLCIYIWFMQIIWTRWNKYKIFCFKTKASVKEHVFWPKHIILFNTNILEQFTHMFEIIKVSNMVLKNIFSRHWKIKNKIFHFCLLKWHVASTSISNCCLIFENVSASEVLILYIFGFHVVLVLVQLQVGLYEFPLHLILDLCSKTLTFWEVFFKGPQWK